MTRVRIGSFLALLMIAGVALRIIASGDRLLWQDEAETTINSLQVVDHGYPSDTYKGKPIFENASYLPSDDPIYEYASTNYIGTRFERNKGWLTYYYQALFLKLFGFSTFIARLPFILLFCGSLLLLYKLAHHFFKSQAAALTASALYAFNYYSIMYERQARYFSLLTLASLWCLYSIYRAITKGRTRDYVLSGVSLAVLFHVHLTAAISMSVFFIIAHWYWHRSLRAALNAHTLLSFALLAAAAIPWIIAVRFWTVFNTFSDHRGVFLWVSVLVGLLIAALFYRYVLPIRRHALSDRTPGNFLLLFIVIVLLVKPLITPEESIGARVFVELNPILCALVAYTLHSLVSLRRQHQQAGATYIHLTILVLFYLFINVLMGGPTRQVYDTGIVSKGLRYLNEHHVDRTTPVFISYQQLPYLLYSDYNVHPVWPIRKSFFQEHPGTMYFIHDYENFWPQSFYRREEIEARGFFHPQNLNFYPKLSTCARTDLGDRIIAYECRADSVR